MKYKLAFIDGFARKPKHTHWQFCFYPLLNIIRHDVISGKPCYQLSIDWLLWGIGIIVAFEKK